MFPSYQQGGRTPRIRRNRCSVAHDPNDVVTRGKPRSPRTPRPREGQPRQAGLLASSSSPCSAFPDRKRSSGAQTEQGSPVTVAGTAPDYARDARFRVPFSFHLWKPIALAPIGAKSAEGKTITKTIFLGGARSGKTRLALAAAERLAGPLHYLATAEALDGEMADRIAHHQAERGARWRTLECPLDLPEAILAQTSGVILVDCLTLWLSNLMLGGHDIARRTQDLVSAIGATPLALILVANEVGLGIVPEYPLGREFRDAAGRLNQAVAARVDRAYFVVAGMVLPLQAFPDC